MEVEVDVNENDIVKIRVGDRAIVRSRRLFKENLKEKPLE
jgi:hypothetical protein